MGQRKLKYPLLGCVEFGRRLLETGDLDPLYAMIHLAPVSQAVRARYVVAYLCFYDTGTASWISDQIDYWGALREAAATKTHPRGGDRRHFRGDAARDCVAGLRQQFANAFEVVDWLAFSGASTTLRAAIERCRTLRGFGITIAFKAVDILERLGYAQIVFDPTDPTLLSKSPRRGAQSLAESEGVSPACAVRWASEYLLGRLGHYPAPPRGERRLAVLETETILCKWQHHLNGTYSVGKGVEAQRKGLDRYLAYPTARAMLEGGKRAGLWVK